MNAIFSKVGVTARYGAIHVIIRFFVSRGLNQQSIIFTGGVLIEQQSIS
jgi:hypothetical protein